MRDSGLPPLAFQTLRVLATGEARALKEVASACGCSRAAITGAVDTLESAGFVSRESHPRDRRSILARITDAGLSRIQETRPLDRVFQSCCGDLGADDFGQLYGLLERLDNALECTGAGAGLVE